MRYLSVLLFSFLCLTLSYSQSKATEQVSMQSFVVRGFDPLFGNRLDTIEILNLRFSPSYSDEYRVLNNNFDTSYSPFVQSAIKRLGKCKNLKAVRYYIDNVQVRKEFTDDILDQLAELDSIVHISIELVDYSTVFSEVDLTFSSFEKLNQIKNLKLLEIQSEFIEDVHFKNGNNLTYLNLFQKSKRPFLSERSLQNLNKIQFLKVNRLNSLYFDTFSTMDSLVSLRVQSLDTIYMKDETQMIIDITTLKNNGLLELHLPCTDYVYDVIKEKFEVSNSSYRTAKKNCDGLVPIPYVCKQLNLDAKYHYVTMSDSEIASKAQLFYSKYDYWFKFINY